MSVCLSVCRTIRRKEEQAKEILGPQVYADLDKSICELLDNGAFLDLAEQKFGTVIYSGGWNRLCTEDLCL